MSQLRIWKKHTLKISLAPLLVTWSPEEPYFLPGKTQLLTVTY